MALQQFGWFPLKLCRPTQESRQSQELGEHLSKSAHLKLFESFRLNTHTPTSNVWPFIFSFKFPLCLCRTLWLRPEGPKKSREIFQTAVQFLYFFVWLESTLQMIARVCARTRVCPSVHTHARISSLWNDRSVLSQPQGALFKLRNCGLFFLRTDPFISFVLILSLWAAAPPSLPLLHLRFDLPSDIFPHPLALWSFLFLHVSLVYVSLHLKAANAFAVSVFS